MKIKGTISILEMQNVLTAFLALFLAAKLNIAASMESYTKLFWVSYLFLIILVSKAKWFSKQKIGQWI